MSPTNPPAVQPPSPPPSRPPSPVPPLSSARALEPSTALPSPGPAHPMQQEPTAITRPASVAEVRAVWSGMADSVHQLEREVASLERAAVTGTLSARQERQLKLVPGLRGLIGSYYSVKWDMEEGIGSAFASEGKVRMSPTKKAEIVVQLGGLRAAGERVRARLDRLEERWVELGQ